MDSFFLGFFLIDWAMVHKMIWKYHWPKSKSSEWNNNKVIFDRKGNDKTQGQTYLDKREAEANWRQFESIG